jgi:phage/plasmid-like protein (TIGR03299 family)
MTVTIATEFSTREVPWMKIGKLEKKAKTAAQAAKMVGLDFTVSKRPAGFMDADGKTIWTENRVAVVRDDTEELFEYVGKDYEALQFGEAFDFMDAISPRFVAAGQLRGGRQGFMVVEPEVKIAPLGDEHELFIVLRTSHDRSRALEVSIMSLRGKCMNQLTLSTFSKGAKQRWSIPHTTTMRDKMKEAQFTMAQLDKYTAAFNRLAEKLMLVHPTEKRARAILEDAVPHYLGGKGRPKVLDTIVDLWHNDEDRVGYNDTGWGLVNAASEFLEWHRQGRPDNTEARFMTALNGGTHKTLDRIARETLTLAA